MAKKRDTPIAGEKMSDTSAALDWPMCGVKMARASTLLLLFSYFARNTVSSTDGISNLLVRQV
jgi:hypothetical protein